MQQQSSIEAYLGGGGGGGGGGASRSGSPVLPWPLSSSLHHHHHVGFNPEFHHELQINNPEPFGQLLAPAPAPSYEGFSFNRRPHHGMQFAYELPASDHHHHHHHHLRLISDTLGQVVHPAAAAAPFGFQSELQKLTAQEIMDAKALAASKSHSEAERRRRERINNHLAKLRSILPSTTKTDKASLLAEVIQHVKELRRQTSAIAETSPVPTEIDELSVDKSCDEEGKFVIKASLCCEDRSDLLPDLINTLKALNLRTLKAEITTLGGRVRNVLFFTTEEDSDEIDYDASINSIQEALKAVMEKSGGDHHHHHSAASASVNKRQRTSLNNILGT